MYTPKFIHSDDPEPHILRRKEMIRKYPELKTLNGNTPTTFFWILGVVLLQVCTAVVVSSQ
jgi:sphingolipid delta-4 desaturase